MKTLLVILQGGLGNQLFELASALQWRDEHGVRVLIDDKTGFFADRFKRTCTVDSLVDLPSLGIRRSPWTALPFRYAGKLWRGIAGPIERCGPTATDANLTALKDWMVGSGSGFQVLDGYWQSGVDGQGARRRLLPHVRSSWLAARESTDLARLRPEGTELVGVHLRLRYSYSSDNRFVTALPSVPLTYYRSAIQAIRRSFDRPLFVICADTTVSDEELSGLGFSPFLNLARGSRTEAEDFETLRQCSSHILSNSSFAWWGATLKDATNGITICPEFSRFSQMMLPQPGWNVISVNAGDEIPAVAGLSK